MTFFKWCGKDLKGTVLLTKRSGNGSWLSSTIHADYGSKEREDEADGDRKLSRTLISSQNVANNKPMLQLTNDLGIFLHVSVSLSHLERLVVTLGHHQELNGRRVVLEPLKEPAVNSTAANSNLDPYTSGRFWHFDYVTSTLTHQAKFDILTPLPWPWSIATAGTAKVKLCAKSNLICCWDTMQTHRHLTWPCHIRSQGHTTITTCPGPRNRCVKIW